MNNLRLCAQLDDVTAIQMSKTYEGVDAWGVTAYYRQIVLQDSNGKDIAVLRVRGDASVVTNR